MLNALAPATEAWAVVGLPDGLLPVAGWSAAVGGLLSLNGGLRLPTPLADPPGGLGPGLRYGARVVGLSFFIRWVVGGVLFWTALPVVGLLHARSEGADLRRTLETLLLYLLVTGFGVAGVWNFVGHYFMSAPVAASIGWSVSPFQHELAFAQLGLGLTGVLCLWIRDRFWLAVALPWCVFLYGAGWVHLREFLGAGNDAPANWGFAMFFGDVLVPTLVLVVLVWHARVGGWEERIDGAAGGSSG